MSFESPDNEKNFPGLYKSGVIPEQLSVSEDDIERQSKKKELGLGKKKDGKRDKKEKGYTQFEEEESEEEIIAMDDIKSPSKVKKSKPGFKFPARKDIFVKKEKHVPEEKKEKEQRKEEKDKKKEEKDGKKHKIKDRKKGKHRFPHGERKEEESTTIATPIFGIPLAQAVERNRCHDGIELPAIFRECVDYIEEYGLSCEGIYRISGVKSKVQHLKDCYNRGIVAHLEEAEPNVVASLLKQFLRELPEPVLTTAAMPKFEEASTIKNNKKRVDQFKKLIDDLPTCNRLLLSWMIVHMTHIIQRQKENKMTLQNVSIVLSPTMQISHRVLNVLFTNTNQIFAEDLVKSLPRYVPPLRPATSRWSLELPDTPAGAEEELAKQESLLSQLHEELNAGVKDPVKEEQLWEVQRVVTQLKRKIKLAKKGVDVADKRRKELEVKKNSSNLADVEELQLTLREVPKVTEASSEEKKPDSTSEHSEEKDSKLKSSTDKAKTKEAAPAPPPTATSKQPVSVPGSPSTTAATSKQSVSVPAASTVTTTTTETVTSKQQVRLSATASASPADDKKVAKSEVEVETKPAQETQMEVKESSRKNEGESKPMEERGESDQTDGKKEGSQMKEIETNEFIETDEMLEKTKVKEEKEKIKEEMKNLETKEDSLQKDVVKDEGIPVHPLVHLTNELLQPVKAEPVPCKKEETVEESFRKSEELRFLEEELLGEKKTTEKRKVKFSEVNKPVSEVKVDKQNMPFTIHADVHMDGKEEVMWDDVDDEETQALLEECEAQKMEEEELLAIADELRQKIETEESEIERLHLEIQELQYLRQDSDLEDMSSSSDSSDESEDEEELEEILLSLKQENEMLEKQNSELCQKIHEERMICLTVKLEIRLLQQRQLESSTNSSSGMDRETFL